MSYEENQKKFETITNRQSSKVRNKETRAGRPCYEGKDGAKRKPLPKGGGRGSEFDGIRRSPPAAGKPGKPDRRPPNEFSWRRKGIRVSPGRWRRPQDRQRDRVMPAHCGGILPPQCGDELRATGKRRNPNIEIRNSKQYRMPKARMFETKSFCPSRSNTPLVSNLKRAAFSTTPDRTIPPGMGRSRLRCRDPRRRRMAHVGG
jgi:hypothetical protein